MCARCVAVSEIKHERYSIKPVHDILYVDLKGTWLAEDTLTFTTEFKKQVSRYFARSWACVMSIKDLDMLVDDSFQIDSFVALNTWSYIKGMSHMVIVTGSQKRDMLLYQFEEILKAKQPFSMEVFMTEFPAQQWLKDHGFNMESASSNRRIA